MKVISLLIGGAIVYAVMTGAVYFVSIQNMPLLLVLLIVCVAFFARTTRGAGR